MASIHRTVQCPIEGLEAVAVTYNLMASAEQIEALTESLGDTGVDACILSVSGWPEAEYGKEPFGKKCAAGLSGLGGATWVAAGGQGLCH